MKIRNSFVSNSSSSSFICYGWKIEDENKIARQLAKIYLKEKEYKLALQYIEKENYYSVYQMLPFNPKLNCWSEDNSNIYFGVSIFFNDDDEWAIREFVIDQTVVGNVMKDLDLPAPKIFYGIVAS